MLAGGNEKFPPANILSFLPSHYNDYHAFVSSTEHGFFRILGEMSLRGQERKFIFLTFKASCDTLNIKCYVT